MIARLSAAIVFTVLAGACQTTSAAVPAVLAHGDDASMGALKAALAKSVGRAQVDLGPGDPTQSSVISVLPRPLGPLEDRSLARPTLFHLELEGETCILVRDDTRARVQLNGVQCRAATP